MQFKLCTLMYGIHNSQCPSYMSDVVQLLATTSTRRGLRPAARIYYLTPRLRSKFGERAFSYAAAWNRLPETIRQAQTQTLVKKLFKNIFIQRIFTIVVKLVRSATLFVSAR